MVKIKSYLHNFVKNNSKMRLSYLIFVILIVASLIAGYFMYDNSIKDKVAQDQTRTLSSEEVILLIDEVDQLVDDGGYSSAKLKLEGAIVQAGDKESKVLLLKELSSVYYDDKNYNKALETIQSAISADPNSVNSSTYDFAAGIYVGLGDKENAIKYYQMAISQLDGGSGWESNRITSLQEEIDNLQGGATR